MGRSIPGLYLGAGGEKLAFSASTVGFKTTLHYYSGYQLNGFYIFRPGNILWGKVEAGIGAGVYFYKLGYRENINDFNGAQRSNFAAGPSVRVFWHLLSSCFIGIESMLGLRNLYLNALLSVQDSTQLVAGISF